MWLSNFGERIRLQTSTHGGKSYIVDANKDGFNDIIASSGGSAVPFRVSLFLNDQNNNFPRTFRTNQFQNKYMDTYESFTIADIRQNGSIGFLAIGNGDFVFGNINDTYDGVEEFRDGRARGNMYIYQKNGSTIIADVGGYKGGGGWRQYVDLILYEAELRDNNIVGWNETRYEDDHR